MTLEKQLDISTQFKVHHSEVRQIYSPMEKIQANLARCGHPSKFIPRSDYAMLRETEKIPKSYMCDSTGLS